MEDLDFKFSNVRPEKMSDFEICIVNDLYTTLINEVDPFLVIEYLQTKNSIDAVFYTKFHQNVLKLCWTRQEAFDFLAQNLVCLCSLRTLINILGDLGYHRISETLLHRMLLPNNSVARVNRTDMSSRKDFKTLKRRVWNAEFKDPLKHLRCLAEQLKRSMLNQKDIYKKQLLADKVVAILGAEIDAHAITFDTELSDHFLFKELREIVPLTSNTMITDVILYGRRANACAIGKHFTMGEKYLQMAKTYSAFMTPCLEIANMIYCEVYVKLWEFEQTPNSAIRESLIQMAEVGIDCLRDEEEEIRLLWTRMFMLRMIFCLLGIGNRANLIKDCPISNACLRKARSALVILDKTVDGMDTRREMFYRMAWARLYDLENCLINSLRSITISLRLALEGNFKEKCFIQEYMLQIKESSNESQIIYQNTSLGSSTEDLMGDLMLNQKVTEISDEYNSLPQGFASLESHAVQCNRNDWFHTWSTQEPVFGIVEEHSVPILNTGSFCNISIENASEQTVPVFEIHRTCLSPFQSNSGLQNMLSSVNARACAASHVYSDHESFCCLTNLNCVPFPLLESIESPSLHTKPKPVLLSEIDRPTAIMHRNELPITWGDLDEKHNLSGDISAPSLNADSFESFENVS